MRIGIPKPHRVYNPGKDAVVIISAIAPPSV